MARLRISVNDNGVPEKIRRQLRKGMKRSADDLTGEMEKRARRRIRREGAIWNRELLNSFQDAEYNIPTRTRASLKNLSDHAPFQEHGVSGVFVKRDTPFEYTDTKPPLEALIPWVEDNLVGTGFWPDGVKKPGTGSDLPDEEGNPTDAVTASTSADAGGVEVTEPDVPPEERDIDDWSALTANDGIERFWVGQEVTYRKGGTEYTREVDNITGNGLVFRYTGDDGLKRAHIIRWGDTEDVALSHENWAAKGPLARRQSIYDSALRAATDDNTDTKPSGGEDEARELIANFLAYTLPDSIPHDEGETMALRLANGLQEVVIQDGAAIGNSSWGYPFYRWKVGVNASSGTTPTDRDYWNPEETNWHELQHASAMVGNYDTLTNHLAHAYNGGKFWKFMGGLIPTAFYSDGTANVKYVKDFPSLSLHHAKHYLFSPADVGATWPEFLNKKADPFGWGEWKDDVDLTVPWDYVDWDAADWWEVQDLYTLFGGVDGDTPDITVGDAIRYELDSDPGFPRKGYVSEIEYQEDRNGDGPAWVIDVEYNGHTTGLVFDATDGSGKGLTAQDFARNVHVAGEVPDPTDWEPDNDDPLIDAVEAANRAWWKQVRIMTERMVKGEQDRTQMKQVFIAFSYSMTNAHESLAMGGQSLWGTDMNLDDMENFYRFHPYLVKALLRLWGASSRNRTLLETAAENNDWQELLDLLDTL